MTGESYNGLMHDAMITEGGSAPGRCSDAEGNCGSPFGAVLFFVSFFILESLVMLNLIVAVVLEAFEEEEKAATDAAEVRKALQSSAAGKDGAPIEEWNYLDHFFKRFNKVMLDVMAIEKERDRLAHQNGDLRSILKQYLDGISVNEDVINSPNPLLVVNHKTNIVTASAYKAPQQHTIVEGSHTIALNVMQPGRQGASI